MLEPAPRDQDADALLHQGAYPQPPHEFASPLRSRGRGWGPVSGSSDHGANPSRPEKRTASASPLPLACDLTPRPGSISPIAGRGLASGSRAPPALRRPRRARGDEHQADAAVEGAQHLGVVEIGRPCCSQPNTAGAFHAARSTCAASPAGRMRGRFSDRPPPVMCATALTASLVAGSPAARASRRCASAPAALRPSDRDGGEGRRRLPAEASAPATSRRTSE